MSIEIREMKTQGELKKFLQFPFKLYANNPYWAPSIISNELKTLNPNFNPAFDNAEARFFVAFKNGESVGRIASIINWQEVKEQDKQKIRFGWFDVVDDIEVTKALLEQVKRIGQEKKLSYIEGPAGFSNMDKAGALVEGFEHINTMVTLYNFPYYKDHFEKLGFETADEWVEYTFNFDKVDDEKMERMSKVIQQRSKIRILNFKSKEETVKMADQMFNLINETYEKLPIFVRITQKQIDYLKKRYISFINPKFIKCVVDENDEMIAVAITMPSFSEALRKAQGKLFPFGFWHLLQAQKKNSKAEFYLIGIKPSWQNKGVTSVIFNEFRKTFYDFGITHVETNPELVGNQNVQLLWKKFDAKQIKRRKTFKQNL